MDFQILSEITEIETIAAGRRIRELDRLIRDYGRGRWRKLKGRIIVRDSSGIISWEEVHWYEAHGIGRREMKIKERP